MKIALDAGHGYNTAGKRTPDGIREWTLNDRVLRGFYDEIIKYGVEVIRVDDASGRTDVPLVTRTNKAHDFGATVYISFHHNAYQSKWGDHGGSEVWIAKENARPLAQSMLDAIVKIGGLRNRGIKLNPTNFHVTREFKGISMLCEIGFMDSNTDKMIREEKNSLAIGKQMALNFAAYYGLVDKKEPSNPAIDKYDRPHGTYEEKNGWARFTNTTDDNIHMRQYIPNANATFNGKLAPGEYVDYIDVYWGNGYLWVGNGTTWIPTAKLDAKGKLDGKAWGTYTAIPKKDDEPVVKPPAKPTNKPDQILRVGEKFIFAKQYRVDGMKQINGVWAVLNNELGAYVSVGLITMLDANGSVSRDNVARTGRLFTIQGTYTVEKVDVKEDRVFPKGWGFGVKAKSLTEV